MAPLSRRTLTGIAALCVFGGLMYACGARTADGEAQREATAARVAYDARMADLTYQAAKADQRREDAEQALDSSRVMNREREARLAGTAPARVRIIPPRITDSLPDTLVTVCVGSPPECYPTAPRIARELVVLDSLVHDVMLAQMIPAMQREREQAARVIDEYRMGLVLEREAHQATKGRLRDVEKAHALKHTLTPWGKVKATTRDLAIVGSCTAIGVMTGNVGIGTGCAIVFGAVLR